MEDFSGTLIYLIIGYLFGMFFAPDVVSANFLNTDWYNIWTYAWLLGWPFMLLWKLCAFLFLAAPAVVVVKP